LVCEEYLRWINEECMITTISIISSNKEIKREAYEGRKTPNQAVSYGLIDT